MKIRFTGIVSDVQTASASSSATFTWTQDQDGKIKLEEISVAYDAIIQASGKITLSVAGHVVADAISSLSTTYSFTLDKLDTPIRKGETVTLTVQNADATNSGTFQLMVNAYEEA